MSVIHTGRTGTSGGINTSSTGAEGSGGGGSFPLLTDLVAGWALTGGPQQTLSSAGVIASGPLDLTAVDNPTYGAQGVSLDGVSQVLYVGAAPSINLGQNSLLIEMWVKDPGDLQNYLTKRGSFPGVVDYNLYGNYVPPEYTTVDGFVFGISDGGGFPSVVVSGAMTGRFQILAWIDYANLKMYACYNNGTPVEAVITGAQANVTTGALAIGANYPDSDFTVGTFGPLRIWKGANAAVIGNNAAYRTWLYNGGTPRTDAALAAYSG